MKKVLLIDESPLFREYLARKLTEQGFEVIQSSNGLEGSIKMRSELPDLMIMDYFLSRKSAQEVLKERLENPNTKDTPVIVVTNLMDTHTVVELAQYKVKKVFSKPIKLDQLLTSISELMGVSVRIDETPCIIEAHVNDEILFVEVAQGLNQEKIDLLRYKIRELLDLYKLAVPKILLMLSGFELTQMDKIKLDSLLDSIFDTANISPSYLKVLSSSELVKSHIAMSAAHPGIQVVSSLDQAMDSLIGLKADTVAHDQVAHERILSSTPTAGAETVQLRFDSEHRMMKGGDDDRRPEIAIVDDDFVIRELVKTVFAESPWKMIDYTDGQSFLDDISNHDFGLVFLDLMMPGKSGFDVLDLLRSRGISLPVIIFTALSQKESVARAMGYGVRSYLIKPLKPESLVLKAKSILQTNF